MLKFHTCRPPEGLDQLTALRMMATYKSKSLMVWPIEAGALKKGIVMESLLWHKHGDK
jgi:hypothetical protein